FLEAMEANFEPAKRGTGGIDASQYAAERQLATVLHLRIETFYLYAKVLADRLAKAVELFFGQARGISLTKHSRIRTKLAQFAEAHGLDPPPTYLLEKADEVTKQIADFRDRHIVHEQNTRRSWATGFDRQAREASLA